MINDIMAGSREKHNFIQRKIFYRPDIVGIDLNTILSKSMEYELHHKGHLIAKPDLYILTNDTNHIIEVKSGNNPMAYDKGMRQLETALIWFEDLKLPTPKCQLVMPPKNFKNGWYSMLDCLDIYKLGDMYRK
jgi:hypothetical protein